MGTNSKIEWCDHTFNPWWGCVKVSEGCANCYAETFANRFGNWWGPDAERRFFGAKHWNDPLRWNRKAERDGVRAKVFCGSMCDFLEDRADLKELRGALYNLIYDTPMLDWLLLTKRPENRHLLPLYWLGGGWPDNAWLGVTAENQRTADERIPLLLQIPAAVRFVSCEPLLEMIDIRDVLASGTLSYLDAPYYTADDVLNSQYIDLVIVGGESGPGARPMHPEWARGLRDQCQAAGVAFHFKQHGSYKEIQFDKRERGDVLVSPYRGIIDKLPDPCESERSRDEFKHIVAMQRVGKKAAGRILDGREWNEFPEVVQ